MQIFWNFTMRFWHFSFFSTIIEISRLINMAVFWSKKCPFFVNYTRFIFIVNQYILKKYLKFQRIRILTTIKNPGFFYAHICVYTVYIYTLYVSVCVYHWLHILKDLGHEIFSGVALKFLTCTVFAILNITW